MHPYNPYIIQYRARNVGLPMQVFNPTVCLRSKSDFVLSPVIPFSRPQQEVVRWGRVASWYLQLVNKPYKTFQLFTCMTTGQDTAINNVPNKRQRQTIEITLGWMSLNVSWSEGIDEHPTTLDWEKMCPGTDSWDKLPNDFPYSSLNVHVSHMSHVSWASSSHELYWITEKHTPNMHSGLSISRRSKNLIS